MWKNCTGKPHHWPGRKDDGRTSYQPGSRGRRRARHKTQSFRPLLKRAKLPQIRFHDLRHSCASLMLEAGVHPKIVSERLGHSPVSLTLDVYSHVLPSMQKAAAARLDALLAEAGGESPRTAFHRKNADGLQPGR